MSLSRSFTLALACGALSALAGCGDTCSSRAAPVETTTGGCSAVAAGSTVTIGLQLCPTCTDTSPSCTGEVLGGNLIELDSVVQQCQEQAGCTAQGCSTRAVDCRLNAPLQPGQTYTVRYTTAGGLGTTTITAQQGGAASCTL